MEKPSNDGKVDNRVPQYSIDDETEDEEVKLNCIGGVRGYQDSDFTSDSEEEVDTDNEMNYEEKKRYARRIFFHCMKIHCHGLTSCFL